MQQVPNFIIHHLGLTKDDVGMTPQSGSHDDTPINDSGLSHPFSLAGVQTKFSMRQMMTHTGERFTLPLVGQKSTLGNWIVKTPSQSHPFVPENEYSMMRLAELAKIEIPPIKLTPISSLTGIADTTMFNHEMVDIYNPPLAYAIQRFDRQTLADGSVRCIHSEDSTQILVKYPHEKYNGGNYASLAKILY